MNNKKIKNFVIVGGGTAGWMTAAAFARLVGCERYTLTLIESDHIGTVGVGEATLPHLRFFNQRLGISEPDFLKATNATFKAGIEFANWGAIGDAYIHPFGDYGSSIRNVGFHHYWLKAKSLGLNDKIDEYSLPVKFCQAGKFDFPSDDERSIKSTYSYAYHIDAGLYAKFLRSFCEDLGVKRVEGQVEHAQTHSSTGEIEKLTLKNGDVIEGDFFIDCSGFRSLLLGKTLDVKFESWKHWLPCDRAVAAPTENNQAPLPYTRATAYDAGWQWKIPLQHRAGNGYVYASDFLGDDRAESDFKSRLDGPPLKDPIKLRFEAGRRVKSWQKNCVAIGLSSGFLEPLESTSIYLIQIAIMKLMELFPSGEEQGLNSVSSEFNRLMANEYERTRDFLILHYHATTRDDTDFWNYVRTMSIPDSLTHKMELFKSKAYVSPYAHGLFLEPSWIAVYLGQGVIPEGFDRRIEALPSQGLLSQLEKFRTNITDKVAAMPEHQFLIDQLCSGTATTPAKAADASMSLYGVRRNG